MENIKNKIEVKKQEKKQKLMDAAFKIFTRNGINNTTIQEIVDSAGLAKGTFYLYFKDKYDIHDELITKKSRELFNAAVSSLNKSDVKGFDNEIIYVIDYIINILVKNQLLLKFISKNLSWGLYNKKVTELVDGDALGLKELFKKGIVENNIRMENPDVTLFMIIELVSSTCFTSISNNDPVPINEYKPYLYETIKKLIHN